MKLILLGAPGAGKGTQAEVICEKLSIPAISTGNIIREALKSGTEMGLRAKSYMDEGKLVPDEVVIGIIKDRLAQDDCKNGYILDGFPRTIPQAEALDKMLSELDSKIDVVISIEVADEDIVRRMSGRRVCKKCGASYHVEYNPSPAGENCGKCGETLSIRADDDPKVVADRLKVYHEKTAPLKAFYEKQGKLKVALGCEKLEDTTANVEAALKEAL